jgi:hypothetical protein
MHDAGILMMIDDRAPLRSPEGAAHAEDMNRLQQTAFATPIRAAEQADATEITQ